MVGNVQLTELHRVEDSNRFEWIVNVFVPRRKQFTRLCSQRGSSASRDYG
jgi:hypothetical protein